MNLSYPTDFLRNAQWLKQLEMPVNREVVLSSFGQKFAGFGSCFAMNLKKVLADYHFEFWWNRDICAHYSSATMLQSLRRAVGLEPHPDDEFFQVNDNPEDIVLINFFKIRFFGPQALAKAEDTRAALDAEMIRNIEEADIFIITLGNTKVFKPKNRKTLACTVYGLERADYEYFSQSTEEVERDLNQMLDIFLQVRKGRPLKLFVSVSPQRYLYSGYTDRCSTVEENCLMKSQLRLAADAFTKKRKGDGVFYFPAFEMVMDELRLYETLSTYDHMHINQDFTPRYVVKKFLKNHASDSILNNLPLIECYSELIDETNLNMSRGATGSHPQIVANWLNYFKRLIAASDESLPIKTWYIALHGAKKVGVLKDVQLLFQNNKLNPAAEKVVSDWARYLIT